MVILLHESKYHCTTEKPVCQPCLPVSQLRTLLQNTLRITHYTSNIRIQSTLEHSSPISISNTSPSRRSRHSLIINQSIDQRSIYESMGVIVRDLKWRGRYFLLFLWAIVMDLISTLRMPSSVWINIAPKKSFQSIRSLSTQSSSQSHTRPILFLNTIRSSFIISISINTLTIRLSTI